METWVPLLNREDHAALFQLVPELLGALGESVESIPLQDYSLAEGSAGVALPFLYCAADPGFAALVPAARRWAEHCLAAAVERVSAADETTLSLFGGLPGVAWCLELYREHVDPTLEPGDAALDELIEGYLRSAATDAPFDLIDGIVGIGVYALERPRLCASLEVVGQLCGWLEDWAQQRLFDTTSTELERQRAAGIDPLGLAHGVAAVLAMVTELGQREDLRARCADTAVHAVAALPNDPTGGSCGGSDPMRLAWCHGRLSFALPWFRAGVRFARPEWRTAALELASAAARMERAHTQVADTGFCHGAAGVAHLFNRLYQASGRPEFRSAALYWYGQILDMRVDDAGIAGFLWYDHRPAEGWRWRPDRGLLTGCAGLILALQAGFSAVNPFWDRALLLSSFPIREPAAAGRSVPPPARHRRSRVGPDTGESPPGSPARSASHRAGQTLTQDGPDV